MAKIRIAAYHEQAAGAYARRLVHAKVPFVYLPPKQLMEGGLGLPQFEMDEQHRSTCERLSADLVYDQEDLTALGDGRVPDGLEHP
jgi:hypothetical protein